MSWKGIAASFLLLATASLALASVQCPAVFGSHMVLQRELPVPVWGTADPGEKVTVSFAGNDVEATADQAGKWLVRLPAMPASATPSTLVVKGTNELQFDDVLVGEVWLCSGQSNMEKPIGNQSGQKPTDNADAEINAASHPLIRFYQVPRNGRQAAGALTLQWHVCNPEIVDRLKFSAAGYFFGRELLTNLSVPIGLIHTSYGGTRIEPWTIPSAFQDVPSLKCYPEAAAGGRRIDGTPLGTLYRTMVEPLAPFGLRGFIWYQGESNLLAGDAVAYPDKMRALIEGWRKRFERPEAPFYYVQLAPHLYSARKSVRPISEQALPLFWEAQTKALEIPRTGMITTTDIVAKVSDIHPTNKRDVGLRLARLALAHDYGRKGVQTSGPTLRGWAVRGAEVVLTFDNAEGLASRDGNPLGEFTIAGEDRAFTSAVAWISGNTVIVSSPNVAKPAAVRLGWDERANPNLVNRAGLPVRAFRTDSWPVSLYREADASDVSLVRMPGARAPEIPSNSVKLSDFGASPDKLNTAAFAAAIEAVVAKGGGRVIVPAGTWRTGPIVLRSNP